MTADDSVPGDIAMLKAALIAERNRRIDAETRAAHATANVASAEVLIAHLKLAIEKMRRELYGSRSERGARLLDQMELELEDLEASAVEDEIAAEMAGVTTLVPAHIRAPSRHAKPSPSTCRENG
jgi:hypothetical protein